MANEVPFPKGDTFLANAVYRDTNGTPIDLTVAGIVIEAYLKTRDNRQLPLNVTFGAEVGTYTVESATDDWPLGRNQLIIRYIQGTVKRTAEPVIIDVEAV